MSDPTRFFWDLAETRLADDGVERGTLMGFPCLRVAGEFTCTCDHRNGDLIVKLDRDRVAELLADGTGEAFAPAGRVFREWVRIPGRDADLWTALMDEARERARRRAD